MDWDIIVSAKDEIVSAKDELEMRSVPDNC
jgi:hypothetical protein